MVKETRTLRNAFDEWMKIHDTDVDDFEYNEVEWAYECFKAGVAYGRLTQRARRLVATSRGTAIEHTRDNDTQEELVCKSATSG